jgi:uncharacterized protein YxeA
VINFQDKTIADDKSIGFDYQYYYFLFRLLGLEEGEKIGIEVKDDVHIDLSNGQMILIQLKHTIQTNSSGEMINLTERDSDLWKSLYNWTKIVNDPLGGRGNWNEQERFIEKTTFIIVTNKSSNDGNYFLQKVKNFKQQNININDLQKYMVDLIQGTTDKTIQKYMSEIQNQTQQWLTNFFNKLEFELDQDDLIDKIRSRIKAKYVKESKIDYVFEAIDSNLRKRNYINTKAKTKNVISFEEFYRDYHVLFDRGRNDKLPINNDPVHFDKSIDDQLFITQLTDIYAINKTATAEKLRLASQMLRTDNHISEWLKKGHIVREQLDHFERDCVAKWKNAHDEAHREINLNIEMNSTTPTEKEIVVAGQKCLDDVRKKELIFDETPLDTELSNGQYYLLSNQPIIGWRFDWEEKYK